MIHLKRAYDGKAKNDGLRILVERLLPRGVSKAAAGIDLWLKEVAPSPALRKWYNHDLSRWTEFRKRYTAELRKKGDLLALLKLRTGEGPVTFVFAARDEEHSSARVLKDFLEK